MNNRIDSRFGGTFRFSGSQVRGVPPKDVQAFPVEPAGPLAKYREHAGMQPQQGCDIVQGTLGKPVTR